uniref:Uncharacterized protein n=1 Tax=Schistocephalus solidus TaxID=70667 RepID=A0A0X3Q468_SCHSO
MKLKSVYERSYKHFASVHKDYLENLNYRIQRQANERSHHPLEWPGESSDSDTSSSSTVVQESHRPPREVSSGNKHDVSHNKTSIDTTQISHCPNSPGVKKDEYVQVDWDSSLSDLSLTSDGSDAATINSNRGKKANTSCSPRPSSGVKHLNSQYPTEGASKRKTHSLPLRSMENRDGVSGISFKHPITAAFKQSELPARNSWSKVDFTDSQSHNSIKPKLTSVRFTSCPTRKNCTDPPPLPDSWKSEYTSKFASYPANVYSKSAAALTSNYLPHPTSKIAYKRIRNANVDKITARMSSGGNPSYILDKA